MNMNDEKLNDVLWKREREEENIINNISNEVICNEKNESQYWKGIPEELKCMCLAEVCGTENGYCTGPAINYLVAHMQDLDLINWEISAHDYLRWVDVTFEACLVPLFFHEEDWIKNKTQISTILNKAEELLIRIAPPDYRKGYRTSFEKTGECNTIEFSQKLNVYYCFYYMFEKNWIKLEEKLEMVLEDTKQNVSYLLNLEDAEEISKIDDWTNDFHYIGVDKWEPINWFDREYLPSTEARNIYLRTFERYVLFLRNLNNEECNSRALIHLLENAEQRLSNLCDYVIGELEEVLEEKNKERLEILSDINRHKEFADKYIGIGANN